MAGQGKIIAGVVVLAVVVAGGAYFALNKPKSPAPVAAAPAPVVAAVVVPVDCQLPGPAPVPPNGATASADDMKLGHDTIQNFVLQLEAYQKCRDTQADKTPGATEQQKTGWIAQGDAAVDQANDLANQFAAQLKLYKAGHPGA